MVDPRERLLQEAQVLQELAARRRDFPIAAMEPFAKQARWLASLAPIIFASCGNRFGKTHMLLMKLIACLYGYFPWKVPNLQLQLNENGEWDFPPRGMVPSDAWVRRLDGLPINVPSRLVFVTGLPLERGIGEIVQQKWDELWPKKVQTKVYLGPLGTWKKLIVPNESEVYFGAATQAELAFEGFAADAAFADEPVPARVFTAMRRGLIDRHGQMHVTMTPLGDATVAWLAADLLSGHREDVEIIRGSGFDNPHIDHKALEDYLSDPSMSEAERRARRDGDIAALGYKIVTTFDDHAIIPDTTIEPEIPRIMVVDPHHARPPAIIWAAVYGRGEELVIYREWPESSFEKSGVPALTTDKLAGIIKAAEGREIVKWRVCDPNFGPAHAKRFGEQYRSFVEEMLDYDLHFACNVDDDMDRGIQALRDAFVVDAITKRPKIRVMRHCKNTIAALSYWSYDSKDGVAVKPSEKYKDFCDVVRYLAKYDMPWFSAEGCQNYLTESWEGEE